MISAGAVAAEPDLADQFPVGRLFEVDFDALPRPLREQPLGARVHEVDGAVAIRNQDRLGQIFHQPSELVGCLRGRLRLLVVLTFADDGSAKENSVTAHAVLVAAGAKVFPTM